VLLMVKLPVVQQVVVELVKLVKSCDYTTTDTEQESSQVLAKRFARKIFYSRLPVGHTPHDESDLVWGSIQSIYAEASVNI